MDPKPAQSVPPVSTVQSDVPPSPPETKNYYPNESFKYFWLPLIIIIGLAVIYLIINIVASVFSPQPAYNLRLPKLSVTPVACTQEAKQCPDGSYVSRTGPKCEFKPCPVSSWKTYKNKTYGFSIDYPNTWTFVENQTTSSAAVAAFFPPGVSDDLLQKLYPNTPEINPAVAIDITETPFASPEGSQELKQVNVDGINGYYYFQIGAPWSGYMYTFPLDNNQKTIRIMDISLGIDTIKKINEEKGINIIDVDLETFNKMVQTLKFTN